MRATRSSSDAVPPPSTCRLWTYGVTGAPAAAADARVCTSAVSAPSDSQSVAARGRPLSNTLLIEEDAVATAKGAPL